MKTKYGKFTVYSGDDTRAKWELKYYLDDDHSTSQCRYFATMKEAQAFAESESYAPEDFSIVPNKN